MAADYYAVLGVPRTADGLMLKQAYRRLVLELHPDRRGEDPEAARRLAAITEAYAVLSRPDQRAAFDAGAAVAPPAVAPAATWAEALGRVVDQLFGVRPRRPIDGRDVKYEVAVTFAEAARGTTRTLALPRRRPCGGCAGRGFAPGTLPEVCEPCQGTGEVQVRRVLRSGLEDCGGCGGRGYVVVEPCGGCGGEGEVEGREPLTIEVPPGVVTGERLVVREAGEAGRHGGKSGRCFVVVEVRPDPVLAREGEDVVCERPLPVFVAIAGGRVRVPTVDGTRVLVVPPGTGDGTVLRMSGFGVTDRRTGANGDQRVTLRLEWPEALDEAARSALERLVASTREAFPRAAAFEARLTRKEDA